MDVAVQLAVQVVVALVLQRRAASRALEALHVQVLVLDAHEHATVRMPDVRKVVTKYKYT